MFDIFHASSRLQLTTKSAYSWSMGPNPNDPLSAPFENVQKDLAINTVSAYAAAQEAVKGFEKLPRDVKKTYAFTGNAGNTAVRYLVP
jgi:hypothetical protein